MFKQPPESFWESVRGRAWAKTALLLPGYLDMPALTLGAAVFAVGVLFDLITDGATPNTLAEAIDTLRHGFAFVFLAALFFGVNAVRSAAEIYNEQREQIEALETAIEHVAAKPRIAEELIALRRKGYELRNRRIQLAEITAWRGEVNQWTSDVASAFRRAEMSAADISRFEIVGTVSSAFFEWAANWYHHKRLQKMERQLAVLLEVMAKC